MSLDVGVEFGPFPFLIGPDRVEEFLSATGDNPDRWRGLAPPGYAAAALFVVAPHLLAGAGEAADAVIHGEQSFRWEGPLAVGETLQVTGRVSKIRSRGAIHFVTLELSAGNGAVVLTGTSLFLMSGEAPPAGAAGDEPEPGPLEAALNSRPRPTPLPPVGGAVDPLPKSASRADLVRYAAATGDLNPIHWDHGAARAAGLSGVVCHGLLLASWMCQASARHSRDGAPLEEATFRFRSPLRPAIPATVIGQRPTERELRLALQSPGTVHVTSTVRISEQ